MAIIVTWAEKKEPPVKTLTKGNKAKALIEEKEIFAIGFFLSMESGDATALLAVGISYSLFGD